MNTDKPTNGSEPNRTKYYSSVSSSSSSRPELDKMNEKERPFSRANILLMAGCVGMIILGFALMSGGGSSVEGGFNPDIFSTRRIVVGPAIAFLGFLLMAFAIIYTPGKYKKTK